MIPIFVWQPISSIDTTTIFVSCPLWTYGWKWLLAIQGDTNYLYESIFFPDLLKSGYFFSIKSEISSFKICMRLFEAIIYIKQRPKVNIERAQQIKGPKWGLFPIAKWSKESDANKNSTFALYNACHCQLTELRSCVKCK